MSTSDNKKTVSKKFADDFELVCKHYNLLQLGEYAEAKRAARADLENAIATYEALANEIRYG